MTRRGGTSALSHLVALLLAAGCGGRARTPNGPAAEQSLRATVAAYDSAWQAKDTASVNRLLSPRYLYFTSTGGLSPKAASLGFLTDTSYVLTRSHRSDIQLTFAGPVARLTSRWEGSGRFQGSPVNDDQTCGQIWVWESSGWQLFSEHCVNRPVADSARSAGRPPSFLLGDFVDDYGNRYSISDTLWVQHPKARYRITRWQASDSFALARNDPTNPSDPSRWSRIDWVILPDSGQYRWAFCYTAYQAASESAAAAIPPPNRATPRSGCNGFPFSRMRRR